MTPMLKKLFFGPIPVLSSARFQLYGALLLFGWSFWTLLHAPQGFWDYMIRCSASSIALLFCLHVGLVRGGLHVVERILCSVLFALLVALTPLFIWAAFSVRAFCDR